MAENNIKDIFALYCSGVSNLDFDKLADLDGTLESDLTVFPESEMLGTDKLNQLRDLVAKPIEPMIMQHIAEQEAEKRFNQFLENINCKIGYWKYTDGSKWVCSVCGKENLYNKQLEHRFTYYCPHCGSELLQIEETPGKRREVCPNTDTSLFVNPHIEGDATDGIS